MVLVGPDFLANRYVRGIPLHLALQLRLEIPAGLVGLLHHYALVYLEDLELLVVQENRFFQQDQLNPLVQEILASQGFQVDLK